MAGCALRRSPLPCALRVVDVCGSARRNLGRKPDA